MQFLYKAKTQEGAPQNGIIDAGSVDLAVASLQRRNFLVISVEPAEEKRSWFGSIAIFGHVRQQDIVILSRQLSTLFEAKVPIVESLKVLMGETENPELRKHLSGVLDDIQGGLALSAAMERHPEVFSKFYIAMVKSGEESGKLEEIFRFLADYLERTYALVQKARNALIYPAFILSTFLVVMVLMLVYVIPKVAAILIESGQDLPIYTKAVLFLSDTVRRYGILLLVAGAAVAGIMVQYARKEGGALYFARLQITIPIVGGLYKKLFLARMADNLHTLLSGGISVVRALTITAEVVDNEVYRRILLESTEDVKGGSMISDAFAKYADIPPLFTQMVKIGEETGKLDYILKSVAGFYQRDVDSLVSNLVSLIEPVLIVTLGLGVGILVASVLLPIYNLAGAF